MNNIELAKKINDRKAIMPGHRTCPGCPITIILRTAYAATDKKIVVSSATSCAEVTTTIYPYTSWNEPWIHSVFANAAATISGVETAYKVLKRKNKIKEEIKFMAFAGDGGCYIPGTKILTQNGFKNVENINTKDIIWSINPKNMKMEKSTIVKMHKYNYKNKIVSVNHNFVHFDVSLLHNVPVYNKLNNKVEVIKAHKLLNYSRSDKINIITGNLKWDGKDQQYFTLPSVKYNKISGNKVILNKIKMKNWLSFLGYWISEGHLSKKSKKREKYNTFIAQTKKKTITNITNCLNKIKFNYWYSTDRFIISNQQLWTYLTQFGKAKDKFIPLEFKELSNKYLKILLDALIEGDGTVIKRKNSTAYSYSTISPILKDDVIEIALKLGYRVHLDERKRKNRFEYAISFSDYKPTNLANLRKKNISSYDYNGKIYCPELKKNHIMIIEKDGRISLNMNSFDIGLQSLSGALERGHDFVFVCYDNEGYQNTGSQRSSATPMDATTTTTPGGKPGIKKDLAKIAIAHNIPYVATANPGNILDMHEKFRKAFEKKGPAVIIVYAACPTNMKAPEDLTIDISKLATETNFWPLYECEDSKYKINHKPTNRKPIEEFLKMQTKFKDILKNKKEIKKIQENIDKEWNTLLKLEKAFS
jgi:pyruvate/2-oxoacid:ferredoxin oxidoreductase beta subunit